MDQLVSTSTSGASGPKSKWVYSFGAGHNEGRADMRNLLGGKGANLAEMASIDLPVPAVILPSPPSCAPNSTRTTVTIRPIWICRLPRRSKKSSGR